MQILPIACPFSLNSWPFCKPSAMKSYCVLNVCLNVPTSKSLDAASKISPCFAGSASDSVRVHMSSRSNWARKKNNLVIVPGSKLPVGGKMDTIRPKGFRMPAQASRLALPQSAQFMTMSTFGTPASLSCSPKSLRWFTTWWAPISRQNCTVSSRDAVATTVSPSTLAAIWMAMEPTPPAPAVTSTLRCCPGVSPTCSKKASHAVSVTRGIAAASPHDSEAGFLPQRYSATTVYWAFVPFVRLSPEKYTWSPTLNLEHSLPTSTTSPAASLPMTKGVKGGACSRCFTHVGLMPEAYTRTRSSCCLGTGRAISTSFSTAALPASVCAIAFMLGYPDIFRDAPIGARARQTNA
mmetsp:Transcript_22099/g.66002  ORF Transcript_22099/g.66002 Transcript_22099/m.66002 type:complete len:351 (+) Transcript_22099:193-1245(+)